jgi:hypothetical protein
MLLDQSIEFIAEDELIEATPQNIRLRKMELDKSKRHSKLRPYSPANKLSRHHGINKACPDSSK